MQSGAVYGTAAMLDGMCDRIEAELGYPAVIVATGGLGREIVPTAGAKSPMWTICCWRGCG